MKIELNVEPAIEKAVAKQLNDAIAVALKTPEVQDALQVQVTGYITQMVERELRSLMTTSGAYNSAGWGRQLAQQAVKTAVTNRLQPLADKLVGQNKQFEQEVVAIIHRQMVKQVTDVRRKMQKATK